jgi:RNA polymerase sigma-70 factor (ECF subfamily)
MLRLAFVDGLTIDELGELYAVHRTTAFRWLQQASDRLASGLRSILRESLRMSDAEYDRWCESLRSGLELSVKRYFAATG